jgi:SAM-dependent MidA family methyltransferase
LKPQHRPALPNVPTSTGGDPTSRTTQAPPTPLEQELVAALEAEGPITFADYMEAALYHPEHGYYARTVPGPASDFRTSPSLTPWFGRLIARALEQQWEGLGRPDPFTVVEVGAGAGDLAASALRNVVGTSFGEALRWRFVERVDHVAGLQRSRLPEGTLAEWAPTLEAGEPVDGCVLANEVLDNMPARVFELTEAGLREVLVAAHNGRLVEQLAAPPDQASPAHAEPSPREAAAELASMALPYLDEGDRLEVRPAVDGWCRSAARTLHRGSLVVIDYGDVEPDLWLARPAGSVVTYQQERLGGDPLAEPGLADITAHVDFSHLDRAATAAGLVAGSLVTQRDFLFSLGLRDVVQSLRNEEREARTESRHPDALGALAERGRVEALAARGGLGDLLVFTARTP